jgi:menaquinone-dependent protoporphyrinogen IX oxidase
MKVLTVLHSLTGHTLYVVNKLNDKLKENGIQVDLEMLEPVGGENKNETDYQNIKLHPKYNVRDYDAIVIAGPVRGFSMSMVIKSYLLNLLTLDNKKVVCVVTHYFPIASMGGTNAIKQMKNEVLDLGGEVVDSEIINWKGFSREKKINDAVNTIVNRLMEPEAQM